MKTIRELTVSTSGLADYLACVGDDTDWNEFRSHTGRSDAPRRRHRGTSGEGHATDRALTEHRCVSVRRKVLRSSSEVGAWHIEGVADRGIRLPPVRLSDDPVAVASGRLATVVVMAARLDSVKRHRVDVPPEFASHAPRRRLPCSRWCTRTALETAPRTPADSHRR